MNKAHQRELLLLRHGKSSWQSMESDFDRPVTDEGQQHVKQIGLYLQHNKLIPDFILSSPAQRALHTATIITESLGLDLDSIHSDSRIYNARYEDLLTAITQCQQHTHRLLLIGHNPSLEQLVDFLVPNSNQHLSPATLVQLYTDYDWQDLTASGAQLLAINHGKNLTN